ncbi:MAG: GNAT family N-acetyltransferase [Bacillota bacterium]
MKRRNRQDSPNNAIEGPLIYEIKSQRLNFRKYNDGDFDYLFSLLSDPEMVRYIGEGQTRDREETKAFS